MKFEYQGKSLDIAEHFVEIRIPASLSNEILITVSQLGGNQASRCLLDGKPYYLCGYDASEMFDKLGIPKEDQEIILTLCPLPHLPKVVD